LCASAVGEAHDASHSEVTVLWDCGKGVGEGIAKSADVQDEVAEEDGFDGEGGIGHHRYVDYSLRCVQSGLLEL
jgi:hypothetical protein